MTRPPQIGRRALVGGGLASLALGGGLLWRSRPRRAADADVQGPLRVMGNPYNEQTYRALAAAHAAPVELSFSPRESEDIVRQLLLRAFSGSTLPDIAFLNGDLVRFFVERGLAAALPDADSRLARLRATRLGGRVYGVPFGLSLPVLLVNRRLAEAAGADPDQALGSWAAVLALARRIARAAPDAVGGFMEHDSGGAFGFLVLMQSQSVPLMDPGERTIGFDNPRGIAALDVLRGFGAAGQARADMSRRQARRAFQAGRIGVFATMSSIVPALRAIGPALAFHARPVPLEGPEARTPSAGPIGVVLAREEPRRRAAVRFLRFAATDGQPILAATSGYLPANAGARADATDALSRLADPARITGWFTFPGRNPVKISSIIQDAMQQVVTGQAMPAAAIARLARVIPSLLPQA